jgi:hypothetical protein
MLPPGRLTLLSAVLSMLTLGCVPLWETGPVENGKLPAIALTTITPQCKVANAIARGLRALLAAADAAGTGLAPERSSYLPPGTPGPPRIESCYRSYEMQVWWRSYYCSIGKCGNAAVPGTSEHGLGRAVDFEDRLGELTFDSPGYVWLSAHAAEYGFSQPASVQRGSSGQEAWHWETMVGST